MTRTTKGIALAQTIKQARIGIDRLSQAVMLRCH